MKGLVLFVVGVLTGLGLALFGPALVAQPPVPTTGKAVPGDVQVLIRNEYLARRVGAELGRLQLPVALQGLKVSGGTDQTMQLNADLSAVGQSLAGQISFRPNVQNGRIEVRIVGTRLGIVSVPPQLIAGFERSINDAIAQSLQGTSFRIVGAAVTPEGLIVELAAPS